MVIMELYILCLSTRSDGLSDDEKRALLLITTGDPDKYSFAAENQYHADKFYTFLAKRGIHSTIPNDRAIASDAGIGETKNGNWFEYQFRSSKRGTYYKQQYKEHKED